MKTPAEIKFDKIIKDGIHQQLKPLGFKKKGNNFYLQLPDLGQILNIQKSSLYSKDHIKFTINTGLFIPEYWLTYYTYHNGEIPAFPREPVCAIRQRIGMLKYKYDKWFEIDSDTDIESMVAEMIDNIKNFILPYFNTAQTKTDILQILENKTLPTNPFARLIIYGEYKQFDKAQTEYEILINDQNTSENFQSALHKYKKRYGLENPIKSQDGA